MAQDNGNGMWGKLAVLIAGVGGVVAVISNIADIKVAFFGRPEPPPVSDTMGLVFSCESRPSVDTKSESDYYLVVTTSQQKRDVIRWTSDFFTASGYPPNVRCNEVPERFQEAYDRNEFEYLSNGTMNNEPVICTSTEDGKCLTMLVTLKPDDDGMQAMRQFADTLSGRAVGAIPMSSNSGQLVIQVDLEAAFGSES